MATLYAKRRRYDDAIGVCRQLLDYYPDRDDIRLLLADMFLKKAEYQQAIDFYEDLLPRRSDWAALHGCLAYAYLMSDAPAKAEAAYCRVLELKPDSLLVRHQLAQLYQVQGKDDQALNQYRILVEQQPDHVEGLCQLADLLLKQGDEAGAEGCLKRALTVDPQACTCVEENGQIRGWKGTLRDGYPAPFGGNQPGPGRLPGPPGTGKDYTSRPDNRIRQGRSLSATSSGFDGTGCGRLQRRKRKRWRKRYWERANPDRVPPTISRLQLWVLFEHRCGCLHLQRPRADRFPEEPGSPPRRVRPTRGSSGHCAGFHHAACGPACQRYRRSAPPSFPALVRVRTS